MARQRRKAESTAEQPPAKTDVSPRPPERPRRLRDRFSLAGFDTWSTMVRSIFLNALFLIAILVVVPVLVGQFRRDEVVIEPIAVPEALSKEGLTADVAASRIWDDFRMLRPRRRPARQA